MPPTRMIAAVDLGTSKTATAIAEVSDARGIYIHSLSSVATEGMAKGVVRDLKAVGLSVYQSFSQAAHTVGTIPEKVYFSISGGSIESYNMSVTKKLHIENEEITDEVLAELLEMIRASKVREGYKMIDAISQNYTLDEITAIKNPAGMFGREITLNAHAVIAQEGHVRNLERAVERTGLQIQGFVLSVLGSAHAVIKDEESRGGVLVIDFGGGTTDIAFLVDGTIQFSSVIPVGGTHLDSDLRQGLGVGEDEAARLKMNYGRIRVDSEGETASEFVDIKRLGKRDYEKVSKHEILRILEPRLEELIELIDSTVRASGLGDQIAGGAVLVGGGAGVRGFKTALSRRLDVPVRVGYPEGFNHLLEGYRQPAFATVLGMLRYASLQPQPEEEPSGISKVFKDGIDFIVNLPSMFQGKGRKDVE